MPKPVFLLLLLLSSHLHGQTDSTENSSQKGWAVTLTAASIPISQPGVALQPGAEYRFNERLSLLSEIAFRVSNKNSNDSFELNKRYMKFKSELRYHFFTKRVRLSHQYAGLQLSLASRKFTNRSGFYYENRGDDSVIKYSSAAINSPVTTIAVQFGSVITGGRFAVDAFLGIGARFIHTDISNVKDPLRDKRLVAAHAFQFTASYSYAGNITLFHLNGGIRFMWHFYNFKHPRKR